MLKGRKYLPADVLHLLWKWKWLVVVPWTLATVAAVLYARSLPDLYRSISVIQVVPQRVPESLVRTTVNARIEDRLPAITQQILSRGRLERIIQDLDLYPEERKTQLMEDIVARMRDVDIDIGIVGRDAIEVRFVSTDPRLAMQVTDRVASMFPEENTRQRTGLAEGATQFLDTMLDDAKRELFDVEKKLEDFRRDNNGELPSQMSANVQALQTTENQLLAISDSIVRDREDRTQRERMLADLAGDESGAVAAAPVADARRSSAAVELDAARAELAGLAGRQADGHPNVRRLQRIIDALEKKVAAESAAVPRSASEPARALTPSEILRQNRMRELRQQIENLDRDITRKTEGQTRLRAQALDLQGRINRTPTRESEMVALTRDYDTLNKQYTSLLARSQEARVGANLERRQISEQFKMIDQARLPQQPFSPNRPQLYLLGSVAGLALGLGLIALIEITDGSFRTPDEITTILGLPVLVTVPAILTDFDRRATQRTRRLAAAAIVLVAVGAAAAAVIWKRAEIFGGL